MLSHKWTPGRIQFTFKAEPDLTPVFVTARAKGRLDHALRKAGTPATFSRRVGFRTLGHNTSPVVLKYLAQQYDRVALADPRYVEQLQSAAWENPKFDPSEPTPTSHGRYWYDLHLVLVTENRFKIGRFIDPARLSDCILTWGTDLAAAKTPTRSGLTSPGLKSLAVMHDHLHIAFRGNISHSPADMAVDLWDRLNRIAGCRLYQDRIYIGTFSQYSLNALR